MCKPKAAAGRGERTTAASAIILKQIAPIFRMTRHLKKPQGSRTSKIGTTINANGLAWFRRYLEAMLCIAAVMEKAMSTLPPKANWYRPSRRNKIGRLRWANWRRATGHKSPWEDRGEQRRLRHALPTRGGQHGIILRDQFI